MATPAELYSKFSSFPSQDHVQTVCKPGQGAETCRYLSVQEGMVSSCEKVGWLREELDERAERGELRARGDNCPGTLGFIADNQELLLGNKTRYEERLPTVEIEGTFSGLRIENGYLSLDELTIAEDNTLVDITPEGITFSVRGLGTFAGEQTVLFGKPQSE